MKHFFTLVEFEYRKIWKRKSAILAMSVGLLVSILSVWGAPAWQHLHKRKSFGIQL